MTDFEEKTPPEQPDEPWTPRPVSHRILAWVGIVYVVVAMVLTWYYIINNQYLQGIGPLLLTPALVGFGALMIARYRQGEARGGLVALIVMEALVAAALVLSLMMGLPALLAQF